VTYIDLKKYEPAMRTLLDRYIAAEESETLSSFDDMTLVDLIVKTGEEAVKELPEQVQQSQAATAETIENNVRRLIIDEMPTNPKYYQQMSELLNELVKRRKQEDLVYKEYLAETVALTKQVRNPEQSGYYPATVDTKAKQALYDNLGKDEPKAIALHGAVTKAQEDGWRGHPQKERRTKLGIRKSLPDLSDEELKDLFEIVNNQHEY
jgi:type I restriction enzyme, R subunit